MLKDRSLMLLVACGTAVVVCSVLSSRSGFAQSRNVTIRDVVGVSPRYISLVGVVQPSLRCSVAMKVNDRRIELHFAKTAEMKDQVKKSLHDVLVEYFDGDMKQRCAELDNLTSRSSGMSAALEKRAAAKEQLIDLQLKSFKYEAEGLGLFPSRPPRASSHGYGGEEGMYDDGFPFEFFDYVDDYDVGPGMGAFGGVMGMVGGMDMGMGGLGGESGMGGGMMGMGGLAVDPVRMAMFHVNDAHRKFRKGQV